MDPASPDQIIAALQLRIQHMQQEMELQRAQQQAGAQAAPPLARQPQQLAPLKTALPDTFSGGKNSAAVIGWLFQVEQYMRANHRDNYDEGIVLAGSLLRGTASMWWLLRQEMVKAGRKPPVTTWEEFRDEITAEFSVINAVEAARDELDKLKQTGSVAAYAAKFRMVTMQIPDLSEATLLHFFRRGLKSKVQRELSIRQPAGLDDAIRMAERIDVVEFNWQQQRSNYRPPISDYRSRPEPMELGSMEAKASTGRRYNRDHPRAVRPYMESKPRVHYRNNLSAEERQRLSEMGACFRCRKPGHLARDCPEFRSQSAPNAKAQ